MKRIKWVSALALLGMALALPALPEMCSAQTPSPSDCEAYAKRVQMDSGSMLGGAARGAAVVLRLVQLLGIAKTPSVERLLELP